MKLNFFAYSVRVPLVSGCQHSVLCCANSELKYSTRVDEPLNVLGSLSAYQPLCMCVWNGDHVCRGGEGTAELADVTPENNTQQYFALALVNF